MSFLRLMVLLVIIMPIHAIAENTNYKLKAAYLYQFTKFIHWPNEAFANLDAPINICILGKNNFGHVLKSFESRLSQKRKLQVKYINSVKNIGSCHVVFISQSEEKRLPQILQKISSSPVLSVSDIKNFARRGGIIGFVAKKRKIGIEINLNASQLSAVKISSKLLEVATLVPSKFQENTP